MITYSDTKIFTPASIEHLFSSVNWESAQYSSRVAAGLAASSVVYSAWDGDRLVGLIRGLDDGETVGFIHYFLVDPAYQGRHIGTELLSRLMARYANLLHVKVVCSSPSAIRVYEQFGLQVSDTYKALEKSNF